MKFSIGTFADGSLVRELTDGRWAVRIVCELPVAGRRLSVLRTFESKDQAASYAARPTGAIVVAQGVIPGWASYDWRNPQTGELTYIVSYRFTPTDEELSVEEMGVDASLELREKMQTLMSVSSGDQGAQRPSVNVGDIPF